MAPPLPPVIARHPEVGVTAISRWLFNCYLVHDGGSGRPFVVDLGLPSQVAVVADEVRGLGGSVADLAAVVATHGHTDHVAGIPALLTDTATPVLLPDPVRSMRDGHLGIRSPGPRQVAQILPVMADQPFDLGALRELAPLAKTVGYDPSGVRLPFPVAGWLVDGDRPAGLEGWEAIHAPGHSDDSTCLYHRATRTLLSGDAVLSIDGRAWCNPEYVDAARSAATGRRLRDLPVDNLFPGHGRPIAGGDDVLGRALAHDERPAGASKLGALRRIWHSHRHPEVAPARA